MIKQKAQINIREIAKKWGKFLSNKKVVYVPILGPVYMPKNNIEKILYEILSNSKTNKFLSYDKNKRWFSEKIENIILSKIYIDKKEVIIPVIDRFNYKCKIFYYSNNIPDYLSFKTAKRIYEEIRTEYKILNLYFYCYQKPNIKIKFTTHNIYLKKINKKDKFTNINEGFNHFHKLPCNIQKTFSRLGKDLELGNFYFLWKKFIINNKKLNPIVCAISDKKIIGAIGPLDIKKDVNRTLFLLPPNFGVLEKERGKGVGERLWKEAMNYAYQKYAKYTLVQNIPNSPAAKFYEAQGLLNSCSIYLIKL